VQRYSMVIQQHQNTTATASTHEIQAVRSKLGITCRTVKGRSRTAADLSSNQACAVTSKNTAGTSVRGEACLLVLPGFCRHYVLHRIAAPHLANDKQITTDKILHSFCNTSSSTPAAGLPLGMFPTSSTTYTPSPRAFMLALLSCHSSSPCSSRIFFATPAAQSPRNPRYHLQVLPEPPSGPAAAAPAAAAACHSSLCGQAQWAGPPPQLPLSNRCQRRRRLLEHGHCCQGWHASIPLPLSRQPTLPALQQQQQQPLSGSLLP